MRELTAKQLAFCKGILSGKNGSDAYRAAYPDCKANNAIIAIKAFQLAENPAIEAYISAKREKLEKKFEWTREEMLQTLKNIVQDADAASDKTKAIAQASKMLGFDAPTKAEVDHTVQISWLKS